MDTRIKIKFEQLKQAQKKALITFFMPGAQGEVSIDDTIVALEEAGSDLIELGVPFSDPVADGPVIQASAEEALKKGTTIEDIFAAVGRARRRSQVPLLLLVYFNSIFKYGIASFVQNCVDSGIDGLIIPDLPYEEQDEILSVIGDKPLDVICLAARTSNERLKMILPEARGFVYCVSTTGVTGERKSVHAGLDAFLDEIKAHTNTPRAVGFGISTPQQAREIGALCEGVIIGSALVRRFMEQGFEAGISFIKEVKDTMEA